MKRERCWVWFRGGLNEAAHWVGGFYATKDDQEGVLVQHGSYRDTRVLSGGSRKKSLWTFYAAPAIPDDAVWQIN